eukprot:498817-Amphidinium_carterae.1
MSTADKSLQAKEKEKGKETKRSACQDEYTSPPATRTKVRMATQVMRTRHTTWPLSRLRPPRPSQQHQQ